MPGQGKATAKAVLRAYKQNTLDWISTVNELTDSGMTPPELQRSEQLKQIFQRFNLEQRAVFVPEKAFVRFIERTQQLSIQAEYEKAKQHDKSSAQQ